MFKKTLAWLLALCMVLTVVPVFALAAEENAAVENENGSSDTGSVAALTIGTVEELEAFAAKVNNGDNFAGKIVRLGADIDLAGIEWSPIGGENVYFAGEFDGNGKTISNLTQTTGARMGLFGLVEKSYIHDVTLKNVSFTVAANNARVGALAGNLQYWNVVEDVTIDGITLTVNGNDGLVGAVTGYAWKSQLSNVDVKNAVITVNGTGNVVAGHTAYGRAHVWDTGVIGNNAHWLEGTVQTINGTEYVLQNYFVDCDVDSVKITLNGTGSEAGGFFGSDTYNSHSNYFIDCHVTGLDVTCAEGTSQTVGGFIAWNNGTTSAGTAKGFDGCSVSGTINGANGTYGGFVGQVGGRACEYNNASADVDITCTGTAGGFVGITQAYSTHKYTFNTCTATGDVSGNVAGGFAGKNALGGDGKSVFVEYNSCSASGAVAGTTYAGGLVGEVNTELPATNWNTVDSTGSLVLVGNEASETVTGGTVGALIGYLDGVANGDAKEGNKLEVTVKDTLDELPAGAINKSNDTADDDITHIKVVAKVGSVYYETLQAAINACTNGETVKLIADITYDADDVVYPHGGATGFGKYDQYNPSINYVGGTKGETEDENKPSNVNVVIDLNGHTITNNADAYLFLFMDNCKVTFTGEGTVASTTNAPVIWVTGAETLVTIENGKYNTANAEGLIWSTHGGDLVIKGGEFSTTADDASLLIIRNSSDRTNSKYFVNGKATITVTGGTYYGFNPEKMLDDSTTPFTEFNACADGYYAIDNGNGSWTVHDDYIEWIKAELLAGRDVTLEKDIVVDGTYIESIPAVTNGNGKYPNYGIFNVVGDYDVTFDLNGHTITYNGHKEFTWKNKTYNSCTVAHGLFFANAGANLTVKDSVGTGEVTVYGLASGAYVASPNTTFTIEGGTWVNEGCATCGGTNLFLYPLQGGELYIKGGYFNQALDSDGNSYLIVEHGGEYKNSVIDYSMTKVEVTGGTFVGMNPAQAVQAIQSADNKLSWGTTDVVADNYYAIDNGNGSWTVSDDYVAWIKAELLAGRNVTLEKDITVTYDYVTSEPCTANGNGQFKNWGVFTVINGDVKFDLNGHNVTFDDHSDTFCNKVAFALFYANNGGKLTIEGEGNITVNGMATGAYSTAVGSVLTIDGGNWLNNPCSECEATNIFLYASHGGEMIINDGRFEQKCEPSYLIVEHTGYVSNNDALVDYSKTKIEVTGGTFVGMNPEKAVSCVQKTWNSQEWGNTNVVAEGYYAIETEENVWVIGVAVAVNVNTGKGYGDLETALTEAKNGETVKLVADEVEESMVIITKGVTLDLNGKTLTADYLVAFNGNHVVDNADVKGKLVINQNNISLAADNTMMPVWNEVDGYFFINFSFNEKAPTNNNGDFYYMFKPGLGTAKLNSEYFANGTEDNGINIVIRFTWKNDDETTGSQEFVYAGESVENVYSSGKNAFTFKATGLDKYSDMKVSVVVISDLGVEYVCSTHQVTSAN